MPEKKFVGLVYNSLVPEAASLVRSLVATLDLNEKSWISSAGDLGSMIDKLHDTSVIVVAGGDGTILRIVRIIAPFEVPIVGINLGRVGFMAELRKEEAAEKLPAYLNGGQRIEQRMMLQATVTSISKTEPYMTLHALNEVVVGRGPAPRLVDIETTVDGVSLTSYRADAVMVSTATGSTGYALSAGGPILYPETRVFLIQPVAAHTGLRTGLVLPEDSVIELKPSEGEDAQLSVDGFPDTTVGANDTVTITKSPYTARFLRSHPATTFYTSLTRRLGLEQHVEWPEDNP